MAVILAPEKGKGLPLSLKAEEAQSPLLRQAAGAGRTTDAAE